MTTIETLLSLPLSEGRRWSALNQGADVAIRELDYDRAAGFVTLAKDLFDGSAGSFDVQALDVLKARIYWEQSDFLAAKSALEVARPGLDRVESARHSSWLARSHASLGDFARAAGAANRGIEIGRRSKAPRSRRTISCSSPSTRLFEVTWRELDASRKRLPKSQMLGH